MLNKKEKLAQGRINSAQDWHQILVEQAETNKAILYRIPFLHRESQTWFDAIYTVVNAKASARSCREMWEITRAALAGYSAAKKR